MPRYLMGRTPTPEIMRSWIKRLRESSMTQGEELYCLKIERRLDKQERIGEDDIWRLETIYARRTD